MSCLVLKVDYEKTYDNVSWNYLRYLFMRMSFRAKWINWIETCVFVSYMTVTINDSNTKDFKVERGLRQEGPLSLLLFVIVMKGLTRLMERAVEVGDFRGFHFSNQDSVDILQLADETIIFGEEGNDNIWNMKAILNGFELMTCLKINFCKSITYGINIFDRTFTFTSPFLAYGINYFPFKLLGVMVDSSRKVAMWKEVVRNMRSTLSKWSEMFLSLCGRVVLINSVLNSIPLYILSFFKASRKVINEIRSIQIRFLWRGGR